MPTSDQVNDRYNPPGIGQNDFDEIRFDDVETEDLFWLNQTTGDSYPPYRKLNEEGMVANTRTGIVEGPFKWNKVVFQRT